MRRQKLGLIRRTGRAYSSLMKLQEQTILITGAARRVGRAIALELAGRGAYLALHYNRSANEARALADEITASANVTGARAAVFQADLSRCDQLPRLIADTLKHYGRLDALINNAAHYRRTPLFELSEADWDVHLDVNLKAPFFLCREAAAAMRATGGGAIINIADAETGAGWPGYLPYCISKAALAAMTRGLAKALAPEIRVNAIAPGTVLPPEHSATKWQERSLQKIPLQRFGEPEDVARCARFLLEEGDYITGELLRVDGGYAAR